MIKGIMEFWFKKKLLMIRKYIKKRRILSKKLNKKRRNKEI